MYDQISAKRARTGDGYTETPQQVVSITAHALSKHSRPLKSECADKNPDDRVDIYPTSGENGLDIGNCYPVFAYKQPHPLVTSNAFGDSKLQVFDRLNGKPYVREYYFAGAADGKSKANQTVSVIPKGAFPMNFPNLTQHVKPRDELAHREPVVAQFVQGQDIFPEVYVIDQKDQEGSHEIFNSAYKEVVNAIRLCVSAGPLQYGNLETLIAQCGPACSKTALGCVVAKLAETERKGQDTDIDSSYVVKALNWSCHAALVAHDRNGDHFKTARALSTYIQVARLLCESDPKPFNESGAEARWAGKFATDVQTFRRKHYIGRALAASTLPGYPFLVYIGSM